MQTFGALRHFDFNMAGAYAYEQVMETIRAMGLGMAVVEEQYRRAVFNIVARNQDDHVKNVAFLMDRSGAWRFSPAYDLAYSFNPSGDWTHEHQMSAAGERDGFDREDLLRFADNSGLKKNPASRVIDSGRDRGAGLATVRGERGGGRRPRPADRRCPRTPVGPGGELRPDQPPSTSALSAFNSSWNRLRLSST